jgi:hypothetical protein
VLFQVGAPAGCIGVRRAPAAAETAAKDAPEKVAQIAKIEATLEAARPCVGVHPRVAKLIVSALLLRIRKHLVGLVDLLHPGFGFRIIRVQVGVILLRFLAVCLLDILFGRALLDAQ